MLEQELGLESVQELVLVLVQVSVQASAWR
jgi:hypothetical protein